MGWVSGGGVSHSPSARAQHGMLVLCSSVLHKPASPLLHLLLLLPACWVLLSLGALLLPLGCLVLRVNTPQHSWTCAVLIPCAPPLLPMLAGTPALPASPRTGLASPTPAKRVGRGGGRGGEVRTCKGAQAMVSQKPQRLLPYAPWVTESLGALVG